MPIPMHRRTTFVIALVSVVILAAAARADLAPIELDGFFDDWAAVAPVAVDAIGDGGTVDFGAVSVANDQDYLTIRFAVTGNVQPDEQEDMRLYLDTDMNASTGIAYGDLGAELVWQFGNRVGTFTRGGTATIHHADIGLMMGPTVSNDEFEIALRRDAVPANGQALFPGDTVRFLLRDMTSGDRVPDVGSLTYTFAAGNDAAPTLALGRASASHLRLASWNVQNDGLFAGGAAEAAQGRLLGVIDPDMLIICEVWNHSAAQVAARVEQHLPSGPGEQWYALGIDGGNVICSRFPILQTWAVNPGYRITAALIDLPDTDTDLLLFACHWRCCTADADRQKEADSIIGFLRDARSPGGLIDLAPDTPFLLAGDLNLVGWRQQLDTILTGDIINEGLYGPDSPPDWDGSDFAIVHSRQLDGRASYTWRDDGSSYYPGMLDWMLYSGSVLDVHNNFILETRTMTAATLAATGLQATDSPTASDHDPRVADFSLRNAGTGVPDVGMTTALAHLRPAAPNPFNPSTDLRFTLDRAGRVELSIFDARGRRVRSFPDTHYAAGDHARRWNGRDDTGRKVASGVYEVRMVAHLGRRTETGSASITLVQ